MPLGRCDESLNERQGSAIWHEIILPDLVFVETRQTTPVELRYVCCVREKPTSVECARYSSPTSIHLMEWRVIFPCSGKHLFFPQREIWLGMQSSAVLQQHEPRRWKRTRSLPHELSLACLTLPNTQTIPNGERGDQSDGSLMADVQASALRARLRAALDEVADLSAVGVDPGWSVVEDLLGHLP